MIGGCQTAFIDAGSDGTYRSIEVEDIWMLLVLKFYAVRALCIPLQMKRLQR